MELTKHEARVADTLSRILLCVTEKPEYLGRFISTLEYVNRQEAKLVRSLTCDVSHPAGPSHEESLPQLERTLIKSNA